jgi:glycosyltransferase involved in cell wall biosynthesis
MKHFDKGIVLSEKFKINLKPFLKKEKIFVAVNFFEEKFLLNAKEKNFESLKICYVSNLMKEKGIFDLINALIIFNKKNKNFKAKIAGQIFFNKIKTLKNIEYLGVVEGAAKRNLLRDSNVFILPTYYKMEGQPISIIEAMASGNLIISTAHAGIPELVEDEVNGFLVNKKSPEEISDKLFFLANNLCVLKDFSLRNINKANLKFSLKNFEKTMINIISK